MGVVILLNRQAVFCLIIDNWYIMPRRYNAPNNHHLVLILAYTHRLIDISLPLFTQTDPNCRTHPTTAGHFHQVIHPFFRRTSWHGRHYTNLLFQRSAHCHFSLLISRAMSITFRCLTTKEIYLVLNYGILCTRSSTCRPSTSKRDIRHLTEHRLRSACYWLAVLDKVRASIPLLACRALSL